MTVKEKSRLNLCFGPGCYSGFLLRVVVYNFFISMVLLVFVCVCIFVLFFLGRGGGGGGGGGIL